MSLDYIFPDHSKRNHKIAIAVETTMAVIALVLIFWAASTYWISPKKEPVANVPVKIDPVAQKMLLIGQTPVTEYSPTEVAQIKSSIQQSAPPAKLTPEQVQAKRSLIENI